MTGRHKIPLYIFPGTQLTEAFLIEPNSNSKFKVSFRKSNGYYDGLKMNIICNGCHYCSFVQNFPVLLNVYHMNVKVVR